eukprot:359240-Chlamydomonas_euryale.AAC.13
MVWQCRLPASSWRTARSAGKSAWRPSTRTFGCARWGGGPSWDAFAAFGTAIMHAYGAWRAERIPVLHSPRIPQQHAVSLIPRIQTCVQTFPDGTEHQRLRSESTACPVASILLQVIYAMYRVLRTFDGSGFHAGDGGVGGGGGGGDCDGHDDGGGCGCGDNVDDDNNGGVDVCNGRDGGVGLSVCAFAAMQTTMETWRCFTRKT